MSKEEKKISLNPLTPVLVEPEPYSFGKVYFDKFDLITKEINKKEEKEKIKEIYNKINIKVKNNKKYHIFGRKCIENEKDHLICKRIEEKCKYINNFFIFRKIKLKKIKLENPDSLDKAQINDKLLSIESYFEELTNEQSFKNVNNIAITGAYGSGKSSIIETYLANKPNLNKDIIKISLTNFSYSQLSEYNNESENDSSKDKNPEKYKENAIEEEIISELIHQIEPKKIYLSKYKAKYNINPLKIWLLLGISVILFLIYLCLIIWFAHKCKEDLCKSDFWKKLLIFSPLILLIFPTIYILVKYKSQITKIRFLNQVDTELNQDKYGLSKFDKEYGELVYIIKNSKKRIIIFEDLDRLENLEFLTKLRKINYILNHSPTKNWKWSKINYILNKYKSKKIFKFIFVMNDGRFNKAYDKTKFFDLIIPIIPFKNTFNINRIFRSSLSKYFDNNEILSDISKYIDDNRLSHNICNEFLIYYEKIKENFVNEKVDESNINNLFISIVLKNIFPKFFDHLLSSKDERINFEKLENDFNYLKKEINGEYKGLFEFIKNKLNNVSYEDFWIYNSDYFVSKTDRDLLIFLNSTDDFDENKHNFYINDWNYIIRFLNIQNLLNNKKDVKSVIKSTYFMKQIFFKLTKKINLEHLTEKEKELIFNYFLKDYESFKLVLTNILAKYSESDQFNLKYLIIFFTNIIIKNEYLYKEWVFNFFLYLHKESSEINSSNQEHNNHISTLNKGNINMNMKVAFLSSLIFNTNNNGLELFREMNEEDKKCFFNYSCHHSKNDKVSNYEKEFLLFLNNNPSNQNKLIMNDEFRKFYDDLGEKDYIINLVKYSVENNSFIDKGIGE